MSRTAFRVLLIVHVCLCVFGGIMDFATQSMLPDPLLYYLEQEAQTPLTEFQALLVLFLLVLFAALITAWIGLWRFWRWAPRLYLGTLVAAIVLQPVLGPSVQTGWASALYDAGSVSGGALMAGVFLTPLRDEFSAHDETA